MCKKYLSSGGEVEMEYVKINLNFPKKLLEEVDSYVSFLCSKGYEGVNRSTYIRQAVRDKLKSDKSAINIEYPSSKYVQNDNKNNSLAKQKNQDTVLVWNL